MTLAPYVGGAPVLADAPALDLANTHYAVRGRPREGLASAGDLAAWAWRVAPRLPSVAAGDLPGLTPDAHDLERFLGLRAAVRAIARDLTERRPATPADVAVVNAAAERAPWSLELVMTDQGAITRRPRSTAPAVEQVLAGLASDAIDLFTGERAARLRACQAPGCPLFFLKDHPRREWCSPACGNRVRAARAYRRRTNPATA